MDNVEKEVKPFSFTGQDLQELQSSLSAVRLTKYLAQTGENYQDAIRLYIWNTTVSAAFYGPLQALEITLRNRINARISEKYGAEWIDIDKSNIDFFHPDNLKRLREAKERLEREKSLITPPDIIASLSFGFWIFLLSKHYEEKLWRPVLHKAFPHTHSRRKARQPLEKMRKLRNRIAHHEPIFHLRLDNHYQLILETIGQMSPKQKELVEAYSRVKEVLLQPPNDPGIRF